MTAEYRSTGRDEIRKPFTEDNVARTLLLPQGKAVDNLHVAETDHPRIVTNLSPSERIYNGPFYRFGNNPTCIPWSIANAMMVLDVTPPPAFMTDMLNYAVGLNGNNKEGITKIEFPRLINKYNNLSVKTNRLENVFTPKEEEVMAKFFSSSYQRMSFESIVKSNAAFIKDAIDSNLSLVASVYTQEPFTDDTPTHAICISGYRISDERLMDLQILDSNFGISQRKSIEELSMTVTKGGLFAVEKKKR